MATQFQERLICLDDLVVVGDIDARGGVTLPASSITNAMIEDAAEIDVDKLQRRPTILYTQPAGSDVASETKIVHMVAAAGTIRKIRVRPGAAPAGGDKQYTVDVKKAADGSGSFASVLDAVTTITSADTGHTSQDADLVASPTVAADDVLQIVVTASGSTGSQGQGLTVDILIDESGLI